MHSDHRFRRRIIRSRLVLLMHLIVVSPKFYSVFVLFTVTFGLLDPDFDLDMTTEL